MKRLLFLCTGNYYRSRFAEHLFNALAERRGLDWRAESRGLAIERGIYNVGALAPTVVQGLAQRGIAVPAGERFPLQASAADFATAEHIDALDEAEHGTLVRQRFPAWADKVEYWHVQDRELVPPEVALDTIEERVRELVGRLEEGRP